MSDRGTCPRCNSALKPNSAVDDGVLWVNEQCTKRGCLYETNYRLRSSPLPSDRRRCELHGVADIYGRCPMCPTWGW